MTRLILLVTADELRVGDMMQDWRQENDRHPQRIVWTDEIVEIDRYEKMTEARVGSHDWYGFQDSALVTIARE